MSELRKNNGEIPKGFINSVMADATRYTHVHTYTRTKFHTTFISFKAK